MRQHDWMWDDELARQVMRANEIERRRAEVRRRRERRELVLDTLGFLFIVALVLICIYVILPALPR